MQNNNLNRSIFIAASVITVVLGIMIFVYPPAIFPDPSHGFQVMRSMQLGGPFNVWTAPDQDDISKNTSLFLTWWSPGQYLVPYWLQKLFGINTGHASAITILLFELSGLAGFYCFFRKIGFDRAISSISILFIICQVAFIIPFVFYNGGEVLLFGFEGWFLYGCVAIQKPGIKLIAFVFLAGLAGFFCKSSFMWIYIAGLLLLWIHLSPRGTGLKKIIVNGLWAGVPAVLALASIYIFFLSKGNNPTSVSTGLKFSWQAFCFPLSSPLLSGFSVDDLFQGLVNHPAFSWCIIVAVLLVLAALSLLLLAAIIYYVPNRNYKLLVAIFYGTSVLFFVVVFLRGLNISYEARHFRAIGLIVVPGIIYLVSKLAKPYRVVFGVICLALACTSYTFLFKGYTFNKNISARGDSGMAQEYVDQPSLNYVLQLDRQNHNAIFAFVTTDLELEIQHNRVVVMDIPPAGAPVNYEDYSYDGHAGPLYLLLPANYNKEAAMFMKFFPGYSNFSVKKLSAKYVLYSAE